MRLLPLSTASEGDPAGRRWERVLSPVERLSEILFVATGVVLVAVTMALGG
jgi:hypothetical protein